MFTFAPTGGNGLDIEQGVLLDGRRVDPANPDEIVVTELVADRYDLAPGDVWDLVSLSPEQVPELFETGEVPDSAEGPALPMRVVGVVRTTADIAARPDEPAVLMLSPAFFDQYRDRVGMGAITHLVRLVDEPDAARPVHGRRRGGVPGRAAAASTSSRPRTRSPTPSGWRPWPCSRSASSSPLPAPRGSPPRRSANNASSRPRWTCSGRWA